MSNADQQSDPGAAPTQGAATSRRGDFARLKRLVQKELREILRDRRTIITLVVMPILIYPLLAVVFQRFLLTSITVSESVNFDIGVDSPRAEQILGQELQVGAAVLARREKRDSQRAGNARPMAKDSASEPLEKAPLPELNFVSYPDQMLRRHVADSSLHLAVIFHEDPNAASRTGLQRPAHWELVYRVGSPTSEAALHYVELRLQAFNEAVLSQQLRRLEVSATLPAATTRSPISFAGAPPFSLAALIPLILVLMTVTGAVYPAIDLTAGERERGTLESLIAAPVPRLGLLLAKYAAVLTVAILTALVNLAAMTVTANSTGLAASLFGGGMTAGVVIKVLLLLILFAAFFSAILLTLTSYARSFKEAQAYIIPLMLLCLVPGVLCLMPSLEFKGWMAVTPLVNMVMLGRDLLEGSEIGGLAVAAVFSTIFYIGAAIALAARIFGTDAILYGSQATWSDFVRRPRDPQPTASFPVAMLCLALMFPCYFVLAGSLTHSPLLPMEQRLWIGDAVSAFVLGVIPLALIRFNRVDLRTGAGMISAGVVPFVASAILGLALWPAAQEVYLLSESLGLTGLSKQQISDAQSMLGKLTAVSFPTILITMAIVPAILEEFCFRGFLFGALRTKLSGLWTVVASALIFGVFHELLFPGRLLASTFIGLVLGWVRLRTGSILPGMLLHAIHNGVLLAIIYYRDELQAHGWGIEEETHLPIAWHGVAAIAILVAALLLVATTRARPAAVNESFATDSSASKY